MEPAGVFGAARTGSGAGGRRVNLVKLAESQRHLLYAFGAYVLLVLLPQVFLASAALPPAAARAILIATMLGAAATAIAIVVLTSRMAIAYGHHVIVGVLVGVALVIPCAGFLLLVLLNGRVTATLQRASVKVGLLGVNAREMDKLRIGICGGCGYDLRGLGSAVCPECGRMVRA